MRIPEAIIFDMDGVLIDSEPIHYEVEKKLFDKLGIAVSEEIHRLYLGVAGDLMYADIKSRFQLSASKDELLEFDDSFRCEYFRRLRINLKEGVFSLLNVIEAAGLKLAVATSSSPELTMILLNKCKIASLFNAIVTTSETGKSKPAPDVYLRAAQKIGVAPAKCIVFEDSPNGILAAKSAGMYCIAVQTKSVGIEELSKADTVVKTLAGITPEGLLKIFSDNHIL